MKDLIKVLVLMALIAIAVLQSGYQTNGQSKHTDANPGMTLAADFFTAAHNQPVKLAVLANDVTDPENSVLVFSPPASGSIKTDPSGEGFVYQPADGFSGTVKFEYRVCLNQNCKSTTVTIQVD